MIKITRARGASEPMGKSETLPGNKPYFNDIVHFSGTLQGDECNVSFGIRLS